MKILVALLMLAGLGAAAWWFTRDPVEVAYAKCVAAVEHKMESSIEKKGDSPLEAAMADTLKGLGSTMGIAVCEAMRESCRDDRDGPLCKAALAQFE
jgi:hypothetical protein